MRSSVFVCLVIVLAAAVGAKRFGGGGGGSRRGGSSYKPKSRTPAPPPPTSHTNSYSGHFLNAERAGSGGTTSNRGSSFSNPPQTNGPIGFEKFGGTSSQGSHQIGFDKVNSQTQNKPNPHAPSAPPGPIGPPPAYPGTHTGHYGGSNDHPPAYPGRPVNAPPSYTPNNPYPGQGQQHYGGFSNGYPQQNQFGNPNYGSYQGFGTGNTGHFPGFGSGFGGNTIGGGYHGNTYGGGYQGNTYGGSPFGSGGYGGNPYYSPNNFGYSNNPGYFGGHPGQYDNYQKKSRFGGFGGLPIPIPIPIPIGGLGGFGGGGFGGGGFGGGSSGGLGGGYNYNHRLLDTFIRSSNSTAPSSDPSTTVFVLNNSTVTPCTTDHYIYNSVKVSTMSCTAEFCTAIKLYITTNVSSVESVHGASVTACLEGENMTVSSHGDNVTPTVSEVLRESFTVCRNVSTNETVKAANETMKAANETKQEEVTTTVLPETTTVDVAPATPNVTNITTVCETVNCSSVEMCLPAVEVMVPCSSEPCPFRRTGFKPCVTIKMCRAPSAPVSTFASLNTTISKIDEYNHHDNVYDAANLTLISYHPPVVKSFFNCTANSTSPECAPQTTTVAPTPTPT